MRLPRQRSERHQPQRSRGASARPAAAGDAPGDELRDGFAAGGTRRTTGRMTGRSHRVASLELPCPPSGARHHAPHGPHLLLRSPSRQGDVHLHDASLAELSRERRRDVASLREQQDAGGELVESVHRVQVAGVLGAFQEALALERAGEREHAGAAVLEVVAVEARAGRLVQREQLVVLVHHARARERRRGVGGGERIPIVGAARERRARRNPTSTEPGGDGATIRGGRAGASDARGGRRGAHGAVGTRATNDGCQGTTTKNPKPEERKNLCSINAASITARVS